MSNRSQAGPSKSLKVQRADSPATFTQPKTFHPLLRKEQPFQRPLGVPGPVNTRSQIHLWADDVWITRMGRAVAGTRKDKVDWGHVELRHIRFSSIACDTIFLYFPSDVDDPKMHVYQGFERWGTWKDALSWVAKDPDSRSGLITIMFDLKPNPELVIMPKAAPEALAFWAIDDPDDQ